MTAYGIAHLRSVRMGPEIAEYLRRIDATLEPYDGRFLVHGAKVEVLEGEWPGDVIVVAFPDRERARAWYESAAYQDILPLRTENSNGSLILVDGVGPDHRATDILTRTSRSTGMRAQTSGAVKPPSE
jgi:uncharacterized protein (DUF1330 family)